jgi:hypothetical protein
VLPNEFIASALSPLQEKDTLLPGMVEEQEEETSDSASDTEIGLVNRVRGGFHADADVAPQQKDTLLPGMVADAVQAEMISTAPSLQATGGSLSGAFFFTHRCGNFRAFNWLCLLLWLPFGVILALVRIAFTH